MPSMILLLLLVLGVLAGLAVGAFFIIRQIVSPRAAADVEQSKAHFQAQREVAKDDAKAAILRERQARFGLLPTDPPAGPVPPGFTQNH